MSTLREHIKAMIGHPSPLIVDAHAEAALAILNAAERDMFDHETGVIVIVPDYRPDVDQPHHAPGWTK